VRETPARGEARRSKNKSAMPQTPIVVEKWNASDMTINNHQEQKPRVMS
jgi:hypothetical protein